MARSITGMAAARSNRRYVVLALVLALLSAILVYAAISRASGDDGGASSASMARVVVAKEAIPARTEVTASMVELRQIPVNARGDLALTAIEDVVGKVTRYPIAVNEQLLSSKLVSTDLSAESDALSFVVPKDMRAMAIKTAQVIGAGGLVLPGDYVDVIWDFPQNDPYLSAVIMQNVEVTAVQQEIVDVAPQEGESEGAAEAVAVDGAQRERTTEAPVEPTASTVTVLLTPAQAQLLLLAEDRGNIRLALRGFGDAGQPSTTLATILDLVPKQFLREDDLPPWEKPAAP